MMITTHLMSSSGRLRISCIAVSAVLVSACNIGGGKETLVPSAVSINELMVAWIDHAGHELWDVEPEGRAPKSDEDWRAVERHATQIAAAGTMIALGGAGPADPGWAQLPDWKKYSQELTNAGLAARDAARSKNFAALVTANGQLVDVCERCHQAFKPELPTEGKTHQPH
jgi:hypothetical protein